MIRRLRKRIGRLGAFVTFLLVLFAAGPSLEAVACAAEGCGPACIEQASGGSASDESGKASNGCADEACMCAIGHCSHMASIPTLFEVAVIPALDALAPLADERLISFASQGLERPPRA